MRRGSTGRLRVPTKRGLNFKKVWQVTLLHAQKDFSLLKESLGKQESILIPYSCL